ncbi:MAG: hypothetical protein ACK56Q_05185 [Pirellulaceae bacterium]
MAARDRNLFAWQAYVLTMTIISLGLLIALGYVLFTMSTNTKKMESAVTRASEAERQIQTANSKLQALQAMVGNKQFSEAEFQQALQSIGTDADIDTIKKKFDGDMSLFGPDVPSQDRNYSKLVSDLMKAVRDRNLQIDRSSKEVERLTQEVNLIRDQETKAREKEVAEKKELQAKLEQTIQEYLDKEAALKKNHETEVAVAQKNIAALRQEKTKIESDLKDIRSENLQLTQFKKDIMEQLVKETEREDFESAQGKVVSVDPRGVLVWVNMGRKQGLRPGIRFSVLNADTIRVTEATPKAQIEITKVDDNMAQGRVLSDRLNVPVIADDLVYSPTWKVGGKMKFALLGKMDVDGNGSDDRDLVRQMIEQNGGEVVEELGPDGKSRGEIDIYTRYLVVGEMPKVSGDVNDPRAQDLGRKYNDLRTRARQLNVSEMTLDRLMGYLRKYDEDRTIPLGDAIRSEDFRDRSGPERSSNEELTRQFGSRAGGSSTPDR